MLNKEKLIRWVEQRLENLEEVEKESEAYKELKMIKNLINNDFFDIEIW